jgi:hypothetical protein
MKTGLPHLAVGIGLLAETSLAIGQAPSQMLVAQVTGAVPPSGVLLTPPPAPVSVPPSGVLTTVESRQVTAPEFKTGQKSQTARRATAAIVRRHFMHRWYVAPHETTRAASTDQGKTVTPLVVKTIPEQPRTDERGFDLLLPWLGKGKE